MTDSHSTLTGSHLPLSSNISSSERLGSHDRPDTRQSDGAGEDSSIPSSTCSERAALLTPTQQLPPTL